MNTFFNFCLRSKLFHLTFREYMTLRSNVSFYIYSLLGVVLRLLVVTLNNAWTHYLTTNKLTALAKLKSNLSILAVFS